jgi:hypothetical protein
VLVVSHLSSPIASLERREGKEMVSMPPPTSSVSAAVVPPA